MKALGPNHISVHCYDLAVSQAFYVEVFGLRPMPSFTFSAPVSWLQLGSIQLHLIQTQDPAPRSHHFALEVDDFTAAYLLATELDIRERRIPLFSRVCELPDGGVQMFVRDPAGNLLELTHRDVSSVDRSVVPDLVRLSDLVAQVPAEGTPSLFPPACP